MTANRILHNPRCSKSRAALRILEQSGVEFRVVEYLKDPPDRSDLDSICRTLGVEPVDLIRTGEKEFGELGLSLTDRRTREEWLDILAAHPRLLQRPIVLIGDRAVVGRPPEKVLEILPVPGPARGKENG